MPSLNRPLLQLDYFEVKTVEKYQMQEGLSDLLLSTEKQGINFL